MAMTVCVDIGGETTRVGVSSDGQTFSAIERFATSDAFDKEMVSIVGAVRKHTQHADKIVVAAAGSVDRKQGTLLVWGQKHTWWGKSIFAPLSEAFPKATLLLENDANIAALGEAVYGAGKLYDQVGYLTISSGIGGGLIHNKTIVPHIYGLEPAHQIVNVCETDVWSCGQRGCYESYASGTAFKKLFGMPAEVCTDPDVWGRYAKLIAVGLANMIVLWSPEIMVIGGGVAQSFDKFIAPLQKELTYLLPIFDIPKVMRAELSEPGLFGGLAYNGFI